MQVERFGDALWRWTAPHPEWKPSKGGPGGWEEMVGCVYWEAKEATVLIDPLAPPDGTEEAKTFWSALDADVARRSVPVAILIGNEYHGRSAQTIHDRFAARPGARIHAHAAAAASSVTSFRATDPFGKADARRPGRIPSDLPGKTTAWSIPLTRAETAYFLPSVGTLVFADAVLGTPEGRLRVAPLSWAGDSEEEKEIYRAEFRPSIRGLLELPFERIFLSHGRPVLSGARAALEEALDAPAWGEQR